LAAARTPVSESKMSVTVIPLDTLLYGPKDATVEVKNKNDPANAPHRLTIVPLESIEGKILAAWDPKWNIQRLVQNLASDNWRKACKDFVQHQGPVMCNPKGNYPSDPEHNSTGAEEWSRVINNEYLTADIQDRRVQNHVFCFWKQKDVWFVQWELWFLLPQVVEVLKGEEQSRDKSPVRH
jgi:hypothetical protein